MNKCYIILSVAAVALSLPYEPAAYSSAVISEGPWVTDEAWAANYQEDNRDAKEIEAQPQGILARLGGWWNWDR